MERLKQATGFSFLAVAISGAVVLLVAMLAFEWAGQQWRRSKTRIKKEGWPINVSSHAVELLVTFVATGRGSRFVVQEKQREPRAADDKRPPAKLLSPAAFAVRTSIVNGQKQLTG